MVKNRRPNLKGAAIAARILAMDEKAIDEREKRLIRWTVTPETAVNYEGKIREITTFAVLIGIIATTFECIRRFLLGTEADGYSASVGTTAACAWKYLRKMKGLPKPSFGAAARIQQMLDGWSYRGGTDEKIPRGVLDSGKLKVLTRFCKAKKAFMYAMGSIVTWQGMLRHTATQSLTVGDVRYNTDCGTILWIKKRKNYNAKSKKKQSRGHFKTMPCLTRFLKKWTEGRDENEKLFPGWDQKVACDLIRKCALANKWSTDQEWDGIHTIRYGAAQEGQLSFSEISDMLLMKRADWKAKSMVKHYGK